MNYEPSAVQPDASWSVPERWVWEKLCRGEEADFNKEAGFAGSWDERRRVGAQFLRTIACQDPWRGAINSRGVRIVGAWFTEPVDFRGIELDHEMALESCRFDAPVALEKVRTSQTFSLAYSVFTSDVGLADARTVKNLHLRNASFAAPVRLVGAGIGGSLDMKGAHFREVVDMENISVGGSLLLAGALFESAMSMASGKVAELLNLAGARLCQADLSSVHVAGTLRLGREGGLTTSWARDGVLHLRNAYANTLADSPDAWPEQIIMEGFEYNGFEADPGMAIADRDEAWLKWWLRRHRPFSPQPYKQLARLLEKGGHLDKAKAVRRAATEETGRLQLVEREAS